MRIRSIPALPALLAAMLMTAAAPAAAQTPADTTLAGRMRAFVQAAPDAPNDSVAAFFPRRGEWTWVPASHHPDGRGPVRTGVWRFGGAETPRAIGAGGPVCPSFDGPGGIGPYEGRLGMQTRMHRGPWRRVRGTRFVPPGESAASPVFVEWRREDGAWVVSAFGDLGVYQPGVPGPPPRPAWRDTAGVREDAAFAPADWYTITLNGMRYSTYGTPRPRDRSGLVRIGVFQNVGVLAEPRENPDWPAVVYLPTAPGRYQAYQAPHGGGYVCR